MNIMIVLGKPFTGWEVGHELNEEPHKVWETQIHFSKHYYEEHLAHSPKKYYILEKDLQQVLRGYYPWIRELIVVLWDIKD